MKWKVGEKALIAPDAIAGGVPHSWRGKKVTVTNDRIDANEWGASISISYGGFEGWANPETLRKIANAKCPKCGRKFLLEEDYLCEKCRNTHL